MKIRNIFLLVFFAIIGLAFYNKKSWTMETDDNDLRMVKLGKYEYAVMSGDYNLLLINMFNEKIGVQLIPIGDSSYIKLSFNHSGELISKRHVIFSKGEFLQHGHSYHFTDKGILSHLYNYELNILNGPFVTYFENGLVECSGHYKLGLKSGTWHFFNYKGELIRSETYH